MNDGFPLTMVLINAIVLINSLRMFAVPSRVRRVALAVVTASLTAATAGFAMQVLKAGPQPLLMWLGFALALAVLGVTLYVTCSFRPLQTRQ